MSLTPFPHVDAVLDEIRAGIQRILGDQLVGLYLFGSLVLGGFDDASDIDLLAAVTRDVDDDALAALRSFHDDLARDRPEWDDRIEVAYVSLAALQTFRERTSRIAVISPGEPLHFKEAGRDWLMNWYLVRECDTALMGPSPREIIAPVTKAEFIEGVLAYARTMPDRLEQTAGNRAQSYAVLTMCRGLYAHRVGDHASKEEAARWAHRELPDWSDVIDRALCWRTSPEAEESGEGVRARSIAFVTLVSELIGVPRPGKQPSRERR
jgi:hypothetical protein